MAPLVRAGVVPAARSSGAPAPAPESPVRPEPAVLKALLHAMALPNVGDVRRAEALAAPDGALAGLARMAAGARRKTTRVERERAAGWAERSLETIHRDSIHVLVPADERYPEALRHVHPPPCPLFARGRLSLLATPMVAVVGTRRCTAYGRETAHRIATGIAAAGVTVISGLALGIDGVAHRAAGSARTVGVLGCGIDVFYPREHRELQDAIARQGLLLSDLLPGTPPERHNFPKRNRIIAGLGEGVVVVEAPMRSGALITARKAVDSRTVFAVPGPIGQAQSAGTNELIRNGEAQLVTGAREVLQALGLPEPPEDFENEIPPEALEGQALALWRVLDREPKHVDEISAAVGLPSQRALSSLLSLEVQGHARQLPGMRFERS